MIGGARRCEEWAPIAALIGGLPGWRASSNRGKHTVPMVPHATPVAKPNPVRAFGRYQLRQLLAKGSLTMVWLAFDPRMGQEVMLTLPRVQPADAAALEHWQRDVRLAARLNHPNLAHVVEVGVQEHWPFVAVDRALGITLGEWLAKNPVAAPIDILPWVCQLLEGLAFAHEAGVAHLDLQLHTVLVSDSGVVRLMALAVAGDGALLAAEAARAGHHGRAVSVDLDRLRAHRGAAGRDLLACGVLLHHLLTGQAVLEEPDTARVIERIPPLGRDLVRLPWSTPHPIPEALRAIANRATAGQERLRYHNTRTLLRALNGWRETQALDRGGPLALLLDRLRTVGHLPTTAGIAGRLARLANVDGRRGDEIAEEILPDMALSFELLRTVNTAQVQGTQSAGNGPVLTLRRAIALIGINGVRAAANGLRAWPGPLSETNAATLTRLMDRVRLAAHTAQALRPPGYDPEVVYLVTALQNLGRLLVQYHFPEESEQIRQLMQPEPPGTEPGAAEHAGLREEGAAYAVLGVDIESIGAAVARHWGLGEEVQQMMRRQPLDKTVRTAVSDYDVLRDAASAANEAVDAMTQLPAAKVGAALTLVAQRYARVLGATPRELHDALERARAALHSGATVAPSKHGEEGAVSEAAPLGTAEAR
jgi:eukaryotic-like serine/threonine-protein kinase